MFLKHRFVVLMICTVALAGGRAFADSVYSDAKLYYNILNSEVYLTEQDLKTKKVQPNLNVLPKLGAFLEDPDENTRLYVYNILHSLMQNAHNAASRRALIHYILRGITDPSENIRIATSKWLLTFPSEDFDTDSQKIILNFLHVRDKYPFTQSYAILLAGHAFVKDAIPLLKGAARTEDENLIRVKQVSYLALARMGDQTTLNSFLKFYEAKKDTALSSDLLRDLVYTRQPRALEIVIANLKDPVLGPYAALYLSDVFKDFPVHLTEAKINNEDLQLCRDWINNNYDSDRISELLTGEIQHWR